MSRFSFKPFCNILILAILVSFSFTVSARSSFPPLEGSAKIFQNYLHDEARSFRYSRSPASVGDDSELVKLFILQGVSVEKKSAERRMKLRVKMPERKARPDQWIAESKVVYLRIKNEIARKIHYPRVQTLSVEERRAHQLKAWALLASDFEENFRSVYLKYYSTEISSN